MVASGCSRGVHALFLLLMHACVREAEDSGGMHECDEYREELESVPASVVAGIPVANGEYPDDRCAEICAGEAPNSCWPDAVDAETTAATGESGDDGDDTVLVRCHYGTSECAAIGRASRALETDGEVEVADPRARWLARMAHAEAASVVTFLRLARELAAHDAPVELRTACRDAARDEARHARVMRRWARRAGVEPERPRHREAQPSSLEALTTENAIEGCVRETWAAMEAIWQGQHLADAALRADLAAIAIDEAAHAELAWAIDRWARGRLGAEASARVEAARAWAYAQLHAALEDVEPHTVALALPRGRVAVRLASSVRVHMLRTSLGAGGS